MSETDNITLEDIETMITILERFIKLNKKAERIVRYLAPQRGGGQADFMKEFMTTVVREKMQGTRALEEEYEEEPLDEETKAVIDKIRAKKQAEQQKKT
jgi:hypothetical protein